MTTITPAVDAVQAVIENENLDPEGARHYVQLLADGIRPPGDALAKILHGGPSRFQPGGAYSTRKARVAVLLAEAAGTNTATVKLYVKRVEIPGVPGMFHQLVIEGEAAFVGHIPANPAVLAVSIVRAATHHLDELGWTITVPWRHEEGTDFFYCQAIQN